METKLSVTATSEDSNLRSYQIKKDDKDIIWQDLTEEEKITVVDMLYNGFKFFGQFLVETEANKQNNE